MSFKIGDRVRVIHPNPSVFGKTGTINSATHNGLYRDGRTVISVPTAYGVTLDGIGSKWRPDDGGGYIGYIAADLAPLLPPEENAWASEAVKRVTRPQHVEPTVKAKESA